VKEEYFKIKYRPAGILHKYLAMIYFKWKLQLTFRKKVKITHVIVCFHTGLHLKQSNLQLEFSTNKNCHEKSTALRCITAKTT